MDVPTKISSNNSSNDKGSNEYTINWTLFKLIGFYQIFEPGSPKVFDFNIYILLNMLLVIFTTTVAVVGLYGFFNTTNDLTDNSLKDIQPLLSIMFGMIGNFKIIIFIYNVDEIWNLLHVSHGSFLSSKCCKKNYNKLVTCEKRFTRIIFPFYLSIFSAVTILWIIMPIFMNIYIIKEEIQSNKNVHKFNIINIKYPVSVETYNTFFDVFYVIEFIIMFYGIYGVVIFDLFLIAILQLISTQYDVVTSAYSNLKVAVENDEECNAKNEKKKNEFNSIIVDCQNIYKKLKIFYRITRPVIYSYMIIDLMCLVILPFLIVKSYENNGSTILNIDIFKFMGAFLCILLQSYCYCSLFQNLTEKKEMVNVGLYSCDWKSASVQMKKHILLTMLMNDSNKLKMKITPNKLVDLLILKSMIQSAYSITSVMINQSK